MNRVLCDYFHHYHLRCMSTFHDFPADSMNGNNFYDFLVASMEEEVLPKRVLPWTWSAQSVPIRYLSPFWSFPVDLRSEWWPMKNKENSGKFTNLLYWKYTHSHYGNICMINMICSLLSLLSFLAVSVQEWYELLFNYALCACDQQMFGSTCISPKIGQSLRWLCTLSGKAVLSVYLPLSSQGWSHTGSTQTNNATENNKRCWNQ